MQTLVKEKNTYTFEEYLALEETIGERYEYYNGEVIAMAGATKSHNSIAFNMVSAFKNKFRSKGCDVYQEGIKVAIECMHTYTYPDVVVSCDEDDKKDPYFIRNPFLIVEVLSTSTETNDRSVKLHNYRKIKSLRYYLLVSQETPMIEVFSRPEGNVIFSYNLFEDFSDVLDFTDVDLQLVLKDVYEGIKFGL